MIPYSRLKLSDLYALSQSEQLENRTLHSGTYLYIPYMFVPRPPPPGGVPLKQLLRRDDWKLGNASFMLLLLYVLDLGG